MYFCSKSKLSHVSTLNLFKSIFFSQISVSKKCMHININFPLYKKSFQYQILEYFELNLNKQKIFQQYEISTKVRNNNSNFQTIKQKLNFIHEDLNFYSNSGKIKIQKEIMYNLDSRCLEIITFLPFLDILKLLNMILKITPNSLTCTRRFYNESMLILQEAAKNDLLNNHEKVQLLFFISLKKNKDAKRRIKFLKSNFPLLEELPLIEKCIVAQSYYKVSLKLTKTESKILEDVISKEYEKLLKNPLLLVSLCKAIRMSGPSDELDLTYLSSIIIQSLNFFNFSTLVHVLCLYAVALIFHKDTISHLVSHSIKMIENDNQKLKLRLKDIDRFLWSISKLGLNLSSDQKEILKYYIEKRINDYKTSENLGFLVNSLLCLHMLQCWNIKVIENCFEEKVFEQIFLNYFHWKVKARLQILITQINLELKIQIPEFLQQPTEISYPVSEDIQTLAGISSLLVDEGIAVNTLVECPISILRIPGVTLITEKRKYHIDVLDNLNCLKNSKIPNGLMQFKIRLLAHMDYQKILIHQNDIRDPNQVLSIIKKQIDEEENLI